MKRSVQSGYYDAVDLQADPELALLHSLPGWAEVVANAQANLAKLPQPPRPVPVLAAIDVYGSRRADTDAVRKLLGFELGKAQRASFLRQLGPQLVAMASLQQPNNRDYALEVLKLLSGEKYETAEQWKAWLARQPK